MTNPDRIRREWKALRKMQYWRTRRGQLRLHLAQKYHVPCVEIRAIVENKTVEQVRAERDERERRAAQAAEQAAIEERQADGQMRRNLTWLSHKLASDDSESASG